LTRQLVRSEIRSLQDGYRGLVGMPLGEGFVAAFDGPSRAIRFAREVAGILCGQGMTARIGLHSGPIAYSDKHLGGVATELASRIAGLAERDEILLTGTLMGLVSGSGLNFAPVEDRESTGLPGGLRLVRVTDAAPEPALKSGTAASENAPSGADLSPREREVAFSVARGLSNREVASALSISISTVERHVANILLKLGFRSRSQLSAWAAGEQLVKAGPNTRSYAAD
jgi:DNA-binding CsgD family transcriptional regulator